MKPIQRLGLLWTLLAILVGIGAFDKGLIAQDSKEQNPNQYFEPLEADGVRTFGIDAMQTEVVVDQLPGESLSVKERSRRVWTPTEPSTLVLPQVRRSVKPIPPKNIKGSGGKVYLRCVVEADGTVGEIQITRPLDSSLEDGHGIGSSLGTRVVQFGEIDSAAVTAVKKARFVAGKNAGVAVRVVVPVVVDVSVWKVGKGTQTELSIDWMNLKVAR